MRLRVLAAALLIAAGTLAGQTVFRFSGDFRYRVQTVRREAESDRTLHRFRIRLKTVAVVTPDLDVVLALASGPSDADPASRSQTMTRAFSAKPVWIDAACADWHPAAAPGLSVTAGKMRLPFESPEGSHLVWDGEVAPEGVVIRLGPSGFGGAFLRAGGFVVEERTRKSDAALLSAQVGASLELWDGGPVFRPSAAWHDFSGAKGYSAFFDPREGFGNSLDPEGDYRNDYNELEAAAELAAEPFGFPVQAFWHGVRNTAVGRGNGGAAAGFRLGKCRAPGTAALQVQYRRIEKDAVVGVFAASDFAGGGTDNRGWKAKVQVQAGKGVRFAVTGFLNEIRLEDPISYRRLQAEMTVGF